MHRKSAAVALALCAVLAVSGCASGRQVVKKVVTQGVETTSTGPHNVVPANDAQNAVDGLNNATKQTQQDPNAGN